jgi:uncharacterized coiled-coil DUF342 family protein
VKRSLLLGMAFVAVVLASGLDAVKSEPNPEKRARLALDNANSAIDSARQAYSSGDMKQSTEALNEIRTSVDLCLESLNATHKDARKSPKAFKRAEMDIRGLVRRLKSLETDFSVEDRAEVHKTEQRLQEVHDELIARIMSKHKT